MAPLKSLEMEHPIIDSDFQKFCASSGIYSVEDFLIHDVYELAAFAGQLHNSEKLKQGITEVLSIIDNQHQPWLNGMELLEDTHRNKHILPTGCEWIDSFLRGGLRMGQLTELVGPSSSGKTQVCLQAASYVAKEHIGRVVYLDTGNSFSPQHIAQLVGQISDQASSKANCNNLQTVMSSISCHSVFDIFALFDALNQLDFKLRSQVQRDQQVWLLVVDSISSLITPILGGSSSQGHALMTSVGFLLKKLAHEHNIAVLVTNHTVGGEGGLPKPALGESWKSIPHVRILLSRDQRSSTCNITLLKHPSICAAKQTITLQREP